MFLSYDIFVFIDFIYDLPSRSLVAARWSGRFAMLRHSEVVRNNIRATPLDVGRAL